MSKLYDDFEEQLAAIKTSNEELRACVVKLEESLIALAAITEEALDRIKKSVRKEKPEDLK